MTCKKKNSLLRAGQVPRALRRPRHLRPLLHELRQGPLHPGRVQPVEPLGDLPAAVVPRVRGRGDALALPDHEQEARVLPLEVGCRGLEEIPVVVFFVCVCARGWCGKE